MEDLGPEPWNPWATLKRTPEVMVEYRSLHPSYGGGRYIPRTRRHRASIVIHHRLQQVERNAVLAHELLHHRDRCGSWDPDVSKRRCAQLWEEASRLLVPLRRLAVMGWKRAEAGGTFGVWDVAEEFRVPERVARSALLQLDPSTRRHEILVEAGWEEIA